MTSLDVTPVGNAAAGLVSPPALPTERSLSAGVTREQAIRYRRMSIPIIPWRPVPSKKTEGRIDKVPFGPWAGTDALNVDELERRWDAKPDLDIGVATGWRNGCDNCIVIVDCDSKEAENWALSALPYTPWRVRTRSGGLHLGFLYPVIPAALKIKTCAFFFGREDPRLLDIRADGGFAAMPPSNQYRWEDGEPDLEDMPNFDPSWFPGGNELLVPRKQSRLISDADLREEMGPDAPPAVFAKAKEYVLSAPMSVTGQAGRVRTFGVACALVRDFALSFDQAWELISLYNQERTPEDDKWADDKLYEHLEGAYYRGTSDFATKANAVIVGNYIQRQTPARVLEQLSTQAAAVQEPDELTAARAAAADIPGAIYANPKAAFEPGVLTVAAMLLTRDPGAFGLLKQEVKKLGKAVDLRDWQRAIQHRAGQIVETLKHTEPSDENRRRIQISGCDEKDIRDEIVDVLSEDENIFCRDGRIATLGEGGQLTHLRGGGLRNVLLDRCKFVNSNISESGVRQDTPTTIPKPILEMLLELQPKQAQQLRPVKTVSSAPFFWRDLDGQLRLHTTPGYHAPTQTLVFECPTVDSSQFETSAKALQYLDWLFADFPFMNKEEYHNYLGGLLTPLVRPLIKGPVPMLLIEANQQSAGKSHLAKICQILYCGFESLETSFPEDKAEMKKVLFTMAFRALAVTGFDNVEGVIKSPELCAFTTTQDKVQGRKLGTLDTANPEVRMMLLLTVNNGRCSLDIARRSSRVRLRATHSVHQSRTYNVENILQYVTENRGLILSALARLVEDWVAGGYPESRDIPTLDTFETWSKVVGPICFHAGLTKWMANKVTAQKQLNVNIDEDPFVQEWWKKHKNSPVKAAQLVQICLKENLLGHVIGDRSLHSQASSMGSWLVSHLDAEVGGFRVRRSEDDNRTYKLEPVDGSNLPK